MLARCTLCEKTFVTNVFGRQPCPKCGREVFIADPRQPEGEGQNAYAPPSGPAGQYPDTASTLESEGIPWERRAELGVWKALTETLKLALTEPSVFFSRVQAQRSDGLHLFFFLAAVVPALISTIVGRLISNPADQVDKMVAMYRQLGQEDLAKNMEKLQPLLEASTSWGAFIGSLIMLPVFYFVGLYLSAGVTHLVLKLLGKTGHAGWHGTFSTFVYSFSAGVLYLVPGCGWLIMGCWVTALQIIGLAKVQRITTGESAMGVLSLHLVASCCICGVGAVMATAIASLAGGMGNGQF